MLLDHSLIESLHRFRLGTMQRFVACAPTDGTVGGKLCGGGYARYIARTSPLNQMYGAGHNQAPVDFAEIDAFFEGHADNWELILTPFADSQVYRAASEHGYIADHLESVMVQRIGTELNIEAPAVDLVEVTGDLDEWFRTSDAAWMGAQDLADAPSELSLSVAQRSGSRRYLARVDGQPAATAAMLEFDGQFLLAGASTRPQYRNRGLQRALLKRRLQDAGEGALVQIVTMPGTESHRNAQRCGFSVAYNKVVFYRYA